MNNFSQYFNKDMTSEEAISVLFSIVDLLNDEEREEAKDAYFDVMRITHKREIYEAIRYGITA